MNRKLKFTTEEDYVRFLREASEAYYTSEKPLVEDSYFDQIRDEFESKFPNHPYLSEVGSKSTIKGFKKALHKISMGSLQKITTFDELKSWSKKNGEELTLLWSEKIDGLSVSLTYKNGELVQAITRGDGKTGDDITFNALKMSFKKSIPDSDEITIRGEIVLPKSLFNLHFKEKNFVSPRNAAVGAIKRLDGKGCEHLSVLVYDVFHSQKTFSSLKEKMEYLSDTLKLKVPQWGSGKDNDVQDAWLKYEREERDKSDFEMDGLVVHIDSVLEQEERGFVSNRPKFAKAYKFSSQSTTTTIEEVSWQVGRTGRITPLARIDPVFLSGATISNVSLHNLSEIRSLGIKIGQSVIVRRSGDVIPQITGVANQSGVDVIIPTNCPSCGKKTIEDSAFLKCINSCCPAQIQESLLYWVRSLNIKGFGEELVRQLIISGRLKTPADFYKLKPLDISSLDGRGEKTAKNILKEINSKKTITIPEFVHALGIEGIGKTTIDLVIEKFKTLDNLIEVKEIEDLTSIHGIGETTALTIISGLAEKRLLIEELSTLINIRKNEKEEGVLTGITVCFTGFRDKKLEKEIDELGGKTLAGVTKELTYLIAADKNDLSSKVLKAKKFNIPILDIEEFKSLTLKLKEKKSLS